LFGIFLFCFWCCFFLHFSQLIPLTPHHTCTVTADSSYDSDLTIKKGDIRTVRQLQVSLKIGGSGVSPVYFRVRKGCQIEASNDGGSWEDEHSVEACGQLCLHDLSCKSYDAGDTTVTEANGQKSYGTKIDDCHISYENAQGDGVNVICDEDEEMDYYERIEPVQVHFKKLAWDDKFSDARSAEQQLNEGNPCTKRDTPDTPCQDQNKDDDGNILNPIKATDSNGYFKPAGHDNTINSVGWDHEKSVTSRTSAGYDDGSFGFIKERETLMLAVQMGVSKALNLGEDDDLPGVLLQRSDDDGDAAYVVATINAYRAWMDPDDTADAETNFLKQINNGNVKVTYDDTAYIAGLAEPEACASGFVSVTGMTPSCQACPMDTYANRAKLWCRACPPGMQSHPEAGSDQDTKACLPVDDIASANKGAFRYGFEWVGHYKSSLGSSGEDRMNTGFAKFIVTESDLIDEDDPSAGVSITILVEIWHGEFCIGNDAGCRTPGETSYYLRGIAVDDKVILFKNCASANYNTGKKCYDINTSEDGLGDSVYWIGITDRNQKLFTPFNVDGTIKHQSGNTVLISDAIPPHEEDREDGVREGHITLIERCHSNEKAGSFAAGDEFSGAYSCFRNNDDRDVDDHKVIRIVDVRRMKIAVTDATDNGDNVTVIAKIDFDYGGDGQGSKLLPGEYTAKGTYFKKKGNFIFNPVGDGAWKDGSWPDSVPARQVAGSLSDDGEWVGGSLNDNPNCACSGEKYQGIGHKCAITDDGDGPDGTDDIPWCYVDPSCSESMVDDAGGLSWAPCDNDYTHYQQCNHIKLARICSSDAPLCEAGWVRNTIQNRCYKAFSDPLNQTAAQAACEDLDADLTSIHTAGENKFVANQIAGIDEDTALVGLKGNGAASARSWIDETPTTYNVRLTSAREECVSVSNRGKWTGVDCDDELPYICRKVPIGRSLDCDCSGESDDNHVGGSCKKWDAKSQPNAAAWCHVPTDCPRSVKILPKNGFYKAVCDDGTETTAAPTTTQADDDLGCNADDDTQYQGQDTKGNGVCKACKTTRDCADDEILAGTCGKFHGPTCTVCGDGLWRKNSETCRACDPRCNTCSGPRAGECLTCTDPLFLNILDEDKNTGSCVSDCHEGGKYFKEKDAGECTACSRCEKGTFLDTKCAEFADTVCVDHSTSCTDDQFEQSAPTSTTDRICADITPESECECGLEKSATATADTICVKCSTSTTVTISTTTVSTTTTTTTQTISTTSVECNVCGDDEYQTTECEPFKGNPGFCDRCRECWSSQYMVSACTKTENTVCADPTECGEGDEFDTYASVEFTTTSDRVCSVMDQCIPGQEWASVKGSKTRNRVCTTIEYCPIGQYASEGTDESKDPPNIECSNCKKGKFSNSKSQQACQKSSACPEACVDQVACDLGTKSFYSSGSAATSARECKDCVKGQFGKGGESTVCEDCPKGTYSDAEVLKTGSCKKITKCAHGQEEVKAGTATSNAVCKDCDMGVSHSTNGDPCKDTTICTEGEYEDKPATTSSDRSCKTCGYGEYRADDMPVGKCEKFSDPCGKGEQEIVAPTKANDRVCENCPEEMYFDQIRASYQSTSACNAQPTCVAGEIEVEGSATSSTKRKCASCDWGTFSTEDGATSCEIAQVCAAGTYETTAMTYSTDRQCGDCDPFGSGGKSAGFSSSENYDQCREVTECDRGEGEDVAPTSTSDRECMPCDPNNPRGGTFQDEKGGIDCKDATICDEGQEQERGATLMDDRVCRSCRSNTFKDVVGHTDGDTVIECAKQESCGVGFGIDKIGSIKEQRSCKVCAKKTFQPYADGICSGCVEGANFLADKDDSQCTWVLAVRFVKVEFQFTLPSDGTLRDITSDFKSFANEVTSSFTTAVNGETGAIRFLTDNSRRRLSRRAADVIAISAEMDIDALKDLTEFSYNAVGGLDFEYKGMQLTFYQGTKSIAPFTVVGVADTQPEDCTETTAATKTSDRRCKEIASDDDTTTTVAATTAKKGNTGTSDEPSSTEEATTEDPLQAQLDAITDANASASAGGNSSSTLIIIVVVVVLLIAIAGGAFVMTRSAGGNKNFNAAASFENPMYDQAGGQQSYGQQAQQQHQQQGGGQQATGGYMDVGGAPDPTYDMAQSTGGGDPTYDMAQSTGGYMDVNVGNAAGGGGGGGYMDVSPNAQQGGEIDESDEEV
jgi:hypothetical protein